ncbi:LytR/AlgR family response regulator transcription factor [Brumimicrobium oceani]|uniref:DNA-binding response regulator n=1 Tax=Brumimicrobium oceani TaxID=2100725 RepID=A0A2U2XFZ8_9FLAO|nr:response regulator [Brumimicrobium oceani]PWH86716.1 DNA-binding response regulator [Brumimicrobium oceani]
MKISCIAIDDEPLALEMIRKQIEKVDYLDLKAVFNSAPEALKYMSEHEVDCIFLDIEMPDLNGLDLAKIIQQFAQKPEIVFVTAFNQYSLKEFKTQATDFLLKPFGFEEFKTVSDKIKEIQLLKESISDQEANKDDFFLRVEARQVKLNPSQIILLESMGDYVKIFFEDKKSPLIPLITLKKIKTFLPEKMFLQINRSQIINLQKVDSYGKSNLTIGENKFNVSDTFRESFEKAKDGFKVMDGG